MTQKYTISDITKDLGFLLTLTNLFQADEKGFWVDADRPDERFLYKFESEGDGREIVNFQDPMPKGNFYFFNPFAEGLGRKSPATTLYYKTIRVALNVNFRMVLMHVAEEVLASKLDNAKSMDPSVIRMASNVIEKKATLYDVIDEKMVDEFKTLLDRVHATENKGCLHVLYLNNQMTARAKCDVLSDPQWDEKFGKDIRKKTLSAFKTLVMGVLGIKTPEEMDTFTVKYDPDLKSSAKLHTTMMVYLKLYSKFNDVLSELDAINLGELQDVIDRFPAAYTIAKHMIQPVINVEPTSTRTADTSTLSFSNQQGSSRFAAPVVGGDQSNGRFPTSPTLPSRFKAPVVEEARPAWGSPYGHQPQAPAGFGGFHTASPAGFAAPSSGYFGNQGGGFGRSGFAAAAPSNFGSPATRRYFGS